MVCVGITYFIPKYWSLLLMMENTMENIRYYFMHMHCPSDSWVCAFTLKQLQLQRLWQGSDQSWHLLLLKRPSRGPQNRRSDLPSPYMNRSISALHKISVISLPYAIKSRVWKISRELYPIREVTNIKEKLLSPNEIRPEFLLPKESKSESQ